MEKRKKKKKSSIFTFSSRLPEVTEFINDFSNEQGKTRAEVATTFCKVGIGLFNYNRALFDDLSYKFKELIK